MLWHNGDPRGQEPGSFTTKLLEAWARADQVNGWRLAQAFPLLGMAVGISRSAGSDALAKWAEPGGGAVSNITKAIEGIDQARQVLRLLGMKDHAELLDEPMRLLRAEVTDPRPLSFVAGDVVVSHFEDGAGVWAHLELTEEVEGSDEWRTVASLLLSDVEAATVAKNLIDRTAT